MEIAWGLRFKPMPLPPFRIDAIKALVAAGAGPNLKNARGQSPWDLALELGDQRVIDLLKARK